MVDAKEKSPLSQIHEQRDQVIPPLLELHVLTLIEVIHTDMDFGAAGHLAGQLFAQKEAAVLPQPFGTIDRIVVGQGEQVHAAPLQQRVHFCGIVIAFTAEFSCKRGRAGARKVGVDMHVALHDFHSKCTALLTDDTGTKVLKTKEFYQFGTKLIFLTLL